MAVGLSAIFYYEVILSTFNGVEIAYLLWNGGGGKWWGQSVEQ